MATRQARSTDEITSSPRRPWRNVTTRKPRAESGTPPYVHGRRSRQAQAYVLERDFKYLEREQKVTSVLNSGAFRDELEGILRGQLDGSKNARKTKPEALQRLQQNIVPASQFGGGSDQKTTGRGGESVIPINDLRGTIGSKYTVAEHQTRCKLAAVYRLADLFGWTRLIHNHITARAPGGGDCYLVNPFGLMYQEVTASNLVKAGLDGEIHDPGTTQLGINKEGFSLHSAIHTARKDVKCIVHVCNTATVAVSSMSCGFMAVSSEAVNLGEISYHDYKGTAYNYDEDNTIAEDLGPTNKVLILHNHGVIAMGESIEETFHLMHKLVKACEVQVAVMSAGLKPQAPGGVWKKASWRGHSQSPQKRPIWEIEFEALMRMLDNKGYNTGYLYKSMSLLQPGSPNRQTIQMKANKDTTGTEPSTDLPSSNQWHFLEENSVPKDEPLTKAKERHKLLSSRSNPPQDVEVQPLPFSEIDREEGGLMAQQTQKRNIAKNSTGETQTSSKAPTSDEQSMGDKERTLTPLEIAELTAQRVAKSTGKAVETLANKNLQTLSRNTALNANDGAQFSPSSIHRSNPLETAIPLNLTPLQQVELTAEQVAHSTGEAVERLAAQTQSVASEEKQPSPMHYTLSTRVPSNQTLKHTKRKRMSERNRALANGPIPYPQTSETDSDSDFCTTSSRSKKSTPTHSSGKATTTSIGLNATHTPESVFKDGSSPVQKMTYTAEMVARSTGEAVEKLSSSLIAGSAPVNSCDDSHTDSV